MKITVTGHSLIHPRQYMLFEHMAATDLAEVQVISPSRWGSEQCTPVSLEGYQHVCLETLGQSMTSFRLRGLEETISDFNPDILYVMEEPYTPFAGYCSKIARRRNIPMAIFTWENVLDRHFGTYLDALENDVIDDASILVTGNEGAKQRLIQMDAVEDKIAICPQTGINCELFKPMPDVEKTHDVAYFGRMVKEKGIGYIEKVVKELNLKMLWVGGRGDMIPSYGDYIGWVDYLRLPEYYNKAKLFVTYPYAFNGYSEQMNFTIGEAMACGTPVVSSDNGSIGEVYRASPVLFAQEANGDSLGRVIEDKFGVRDGSREAGIEWVRNNLSLETIARRLLKILKAV